MNVTTISTATGTQTTQQSNAINTKTYKIEMIDDQLSMASDDDEDDIVSTDGSMYDGDMATMSVQHDVANQLAAAGPVGVAAAAAIASSKKRKRAHSFETNPSVRKRQQNRLLRKLRGIIYEFTGRVGKQAVVLVATPGKPNTSYKVFGAKPLEDVVRNLKNIVMDELENALAQQAPPAPQEDPSLFELPPLIIDGIPTPVEKMTQAQLRAFIPLMLKYSTGRGKPGWGRESTRPPWWPKELPWANVRMDARSEDEKQKISWTHALRKIVINCYKYHGREDLLPTFADDDDHVSQLIEEDDEMEDEIQQPTRTIGQTVVTAATNTSNYTTQTVLSTIQNADGTVSLIQVDPNNPLITLPDGTTAQVQGVATLHQGEGGATIQTVQSLGDVNGHENMTVDLTEATVAQDGQIYITAEDGQGYPVSVSNMITLPVSASMYQSMMANIQQIHTNSDGTVCITPMQVDSSSSASNHSNSNHTSNNNNNNNNSSSNTNNNNSGHYQCYSIVSAPNGTGAATRLLATSNQQQQTMPPNANQNQTNLANNNQNTTNSSSNSSNSNANQATRCQIFNQNSSSLSHNSSQHNQPQHTHQQQQQQQHTKVYIASNLHANQFCLSNINNNNNNNNTTNNNNNKIGATVLPMMPLPIVVAAPAAAVSATATAATRRNNGKRRKQTFANVLPIKIEANPAVDTRLLNIQILGDESVGALAAGRGGGGVGRSRGADAPPAKAIKLENLEN